jgi:hypothetical protein
MKFNCAATAIGCRETGGLFNDTKLISEVLYRRIHCDHLYCIRRAGIVHSSGLIASNHTRPLTQQQTPVCSTHILSLTYTQRGEGGTRHNLVFSGLKFTRTFSGK